MKMQKRWYLGFLGLIGFVEMPGFIEAWQTGGGWLHFLGLLWFLWFLEFIPVSGPRNANCAGAEK